MNEQISGSGVAGHRVASCSVGGIYDVWTSEKTIIRHNIESELAPACM